MKRYDVISSPELTELRRKEEKESREFLPSTGWSRAIVVETGKIKLNFQLLYYYQVSLLNIIYFVA